MVPKVVYSIVPKVHPSRNDVRGQRPYYLCTEKHVDRRDLGNTVTLLTKYDVKIYWVTPRG